jgi:ATP-GRASP peptide maturase of grasp-with-spasm system
MIVILSYPGDQVANDVMEWLQAYGSRAKRINLEEEDYRKLSVTINDAVADVQLQLKDGSNLKVNEVSIFFFRGGFFSEKLETYVRDGLSQRLIRTHLTYEFKTLTHFFYEAVSKKCLGNPMRHPLNKLQQLKMATECGLHIPSTFIRNCKKDVKQHVENFQELLITKSIQENVLLQDSDAFHFDLKVNLVQPNLLPDRFFPSLFQYQLKKAIEIRTFYLDGKFYSLAMLLCASEQEVIDYRTSTEQLRYGRYQLPTEIETKLELLMKKLHLNTGSIDLIKDEKGTYHFLEVNPTGQIGWVSDYGQYFLEEKIAHYLLQKELNFSTNVYKPITH